ncbi:AAA family ATPase [Candidatus Nomurabacteria bacterium]|nr:AAA family ATPase [Candidatus Nomurabacteria bacterium]
MKQLQALEILKTGANAFLTGEPGSGKTHVINEYIAWLEAAGINVAVTASTGIAATHIGGMTIHSWSGLGVRSTLSAYELDQITTKEKVAGRIKKAKVLVIDEISMLDGVVLESIDRICRTVRQSAQSFGGLQVILVGDFFQLPPVTKQGDMMRYAFESNAWQEARPLICYLTEQYRQEDELFLSLLKSIRTNDIEEDHYTLLQEQTEIGYTDIEPTRLYTHNADVDAVNAEKLRELKGPVRTFQMSAMGAKPVIEGLVRTCLSPEVLQLKEDAMVMCTKNNFEAGYVNGTLGRVIAFDGTDGFPIIKTAAGRELKIKPASWEVVEDGKVRASIEQVPLRLAWAITVHKSQGMSLDAAEIDLSKAFVYGQGYVALSRVRSLEGLKLLGMHPNALRVDPKIIHFDGRFHAESEQAEDTFAQLDESEVEKMHQDFVTGVGGTWPVPEGEVARQPAERIKKESTLEETKRLLQEGNTVAEIAKVRDMTTGTVWSHIEKLIEASEVGPEMSSILTRDVSNWPEIEQQFMTIIAKVGTEKLKPIYEAAGEQYDYEIIRLARVVYLLRS